MALCRPPTHRTAAAILDRALFSKTIALAAARVPDHKNISRYRTQLDKSQELLRLERQASVRADPDPILASKGGKCLLLKPEVKVDGAIYGLDISWVPANSDQIPQLGVQSCKKPLSQKSLALFNLVYS